MMATCKSGSVTCMWLFHRKRYGGFDFNIFPCLRHLHPVYCKMLRYACDSNTGCGFLLMSLQNVKYSIIMYDPVCFNVKEMGKGE